MRRGDPKRRGPSDLQKQAYAAVNLALKDGRLAKPETHPCAVCGEKADRWHHHAYDPQFWLDVAAVCNTCHHSIHHGRVPEPITGEVRTGARLARRNDGLLPSSMVIYSEYGVPKRPAKPERWRWAVAYRIANPPPKKPKGYNWRHPSPADVAWDRAHAQWQHRIPRYWDEIDVSKLPEPPPPQPPPLPPAVAADLAARRAILARYAALTALLQQADSFEAQP